MSVKELVEAAREANPAKFEKTFEGIIAHKLSEAIEFKKKEVVAEMFNIDLSEQELTNEELQMVAESLEDLSEEELGIVAEMEIQEAADFIVERFEKGPRKFKTAFRKEGATGVVRFGAKKLGRGVKRVAKSLMGHK